MVHTRKTAVAIVCGGGPAPGMNSVISAVTMEAQRRGWDVYGIYDGFSHLAKGEKQYIKLNYDLVSRIHLTGGCILHMSRFNPTKRQADLQMVVDTLNEIGVTYLVTIGGDDTAFSASSVAEYAKQCGRSFCVVHVPKTIDNDLPLPAGMPTFGFETARAVGTMLLENLMEDARTTNNRWYFAVTMGRTAGHLALGMGKSAGAIITLIPEEFTSETIRLQQIVDLLTCSIVKRYLTGRNYGVAVIAEGVIEKIAPEDFHKLGDACLDEHGHLRYAELNFGEVLKKAVMKELKKIQIQLTIVDEKIGYALRCAPPISYDIDYTRSLGYAAVRFLDEDGCSAMITMQHNEAVPMPFSELRDEKLGRTKVRRVDIESTHYQLAKDFMIRLLPDDLDDVKLANMFDLSPQAFKDRYQYLFL
ncbi:diphosphate--fructose-6-phosphate 1-phosphotransferase [Propionispira raffinosivorans]|uniref:diphosphate--fructose-6-phosphate 1-phosphotransferase n=1 Tax=Propionispira raffinosivorans TaxID=86959 RepID=UPI0003775AF9|nr:diphosphate--fructose-6-phosphate 1-phosphotransferase [Propionispira raffinosivorans]